MVCVCASVRAQCVNGGGGVVCLRTRVACACARATIPPFMERHPPPRTLAPTTPLRRTRHAPCPPRACRRRCPARARRRHPRTCTPPCAYAIANTTRDARMQIPPPPAAAELENAIANTYTMCANASAPQTELPNSHSQSRIRPKITEAPFAHANTPVHSAMRECIHVRSSNEPQHGQYNEQQGHGEPRGSEGGQSRGPEATRPACGTM